MKKKTIPNKKEFANYYHNRSKLESAKHYGVSVSTISRWAEYFKLPKKIRICEKSNNIISITNKQKDIINGTMLGDACIEISNWENGNCRYKVEHCLEQKEYVKHIEKELGILVSIVKHDMKNRGIIGHDENKKPIIGSLNCESIFLRTINNKLFTELEKIWYLRNEQGNYILKPYGKNGKKQRIKTIPRNLSLTPTTLAYWYFDDGSLDKSQRRIILCTDGFSKKDNEFLIDILKKDLGFLEPRLNNKNRIIFSKKDFMQFIEIMKQFDFLECFKNKKLNIHDIKQPYCNL